MMNTSDGNFDREIVAAKFMIGFFKILGLAPFDVKKSSDRKLFKNGNGQGFSQMQLVSSRRGCFYNLLLIVLQLRIFVAVWPGADELEYPDVTTLTAAIATAQSVLHNVVLYLILLTLGLRQKTVVKLLNRLISVDSSTFDRHKDYFSDTSGRFFFLVLFMGIIVWTVTLVTQYIGHHSAVVTWFRSILPFFVITCFEIKYVFVLNLIGKRFRALNRALLRNSDRSAVEFEDRLFFTRDLLIKDPCGPTVNSIRRAHTNLYEISMGISDYYSLPILFAIGGVTYTALYVTYYMVAPFFAPVGNGSAWIVCNCTSWLIIVMTPIILLASGVTNVAKEMNSTADIVRKLRARSTTSRHDACELKQFASDMLHRKIDFTACGFFPLDCTLVHSIFAMVAGYLVILLQFQIGNFANGLQHDNSTITESSDL